MVAAVCTWLVLNGISPTGTALGGEFAPDFKVRPDDYTVLMACDVSPLPKGVKRSMATDHRKFDVTGWTRADQSFTWVVTVPEDGSYAVNLLALQRSPQPVRFAVACGDSRVNTTTESESWRRWDRHPVDGTLRLAKGAQTITLKAQAVGDAAEFDLAVFSLELVRPAVRDRLRDAALKRRADTKWLTDARYGFMFHWVPASCPRRGERKPYAQAVRDFNVDAFADQVREGGAKFVVITTAHALQYFPAPIQSLESILPGRTTQRDLVADLADALGKRDIRLMLYYHLGCNSDPAWQKACGFRETDTRKFFNNWIRIIREVGDRYGDKLAGWWFDDGTLNYYYRSAPWERLTKAAKAGNPQRLVAYNPWVMPPATEFQDYFCGEGADDPNGAGHLPVGGDGRFTGGPYQGLQACATLVTEGGWVHSRNDTEIGKPRWTAREMAKLLKDFGATRNVPMFNLEIYQDGTMSPATIAMFQEARQLLRGRP